MILSALKNKEYTLNLVPQNAKQLPPRLNIVVAKLMTNIIPQMFFAPNDSLKHKIVTRFIH